MGDIWQAARANNAARVKLFLDQGTSPDITRWSGISPLHRAAETNSCQVAQVLLKAGASVNARTAWGWFAPLHFACKHGHEQVTEILLRAGAKWTLLTKRLESPYDLAVAAGFKIEALKMQGLSRKIAEERRILQQAAPEDALTVATRRKSHAILRRKSQAQLQQYLHSRGSSFQTSGGEAMAGNAGAAETTTELVLAETTATRNGTSESTNGGGVRVPPVITGPVRDRRKTSNCAAAPPVKTLGVGGRGVTRAGRLGLEDMKTLGEPTATLTTIVDEEEECGQG